MHFDLWTLALQAINFLVLLWLLKKFLYRPILATIARRQAQVAQDFADAKAAREAAQTNRRDWEERLTGVADERDRQLAAARAGIEVERREVLERAAAEAAATAAAGRRGLEEERRALATQLADRAIELAVELARTLLNPLGTAAVAEAMLEQVCLRLTLLPPERQAILAEAPIEVATMPALTKTERRRWRQRLEASLGAEVEIDFTTDDSLVVGAELRGASLIIGFSWRDSLAQARSAMTVVP